MIFIDTHTHLYLREFREDRDEVVGSALEQGVEKMLLPNIDGRTLEALHRLADRYPENCLPMIGLHPGSVYMDYAEEIRKVRELAGQRKYWGIGETGIDLYRDLSYADQQKESFRQHILLARESGLPLVIHARNSFDELFQILDKEHKDGLKGVFHAFTGNAEQARKIIGYGFKLGIGGILTFKNAGLEDVVREIGLEHLVLETDAPFLAPVPRRGQRNEPAYLIHTAQKLAEIFQVPLANISEKTTHNAARLFNLKI